MMNYDAAVNRYANLIRRKPQRDYAWAYLAWLRRGCVGAEPTNPKGCSYAAASEVRVEVDRLTDHAPLRLRCAGR